MPNHDNPTPPPSDKYDSDIEKSVKANIDRGFLDQDILHGLNKIIVSVRGVLDSKKSATQDTKTTQYIKIFSERLKRESVNFTLKYYNERVKDQPYTPETAEYIISHSNSEKVSSYNKLVDEFNAIVVKLQTIAGEFEVEILEEVVAIYRKFSQLCGRDTI